MTAALLVGVAVCSALGAVARVLVDDAVRSWRSRRSEPAAPPTPWGIGVVNASGALALGVLAGLAVRRGLDPDVVAVAGTGFLGSYTTFSTFVVDVVRLWDAGRRRVAVLDVVLTLVAGLALAGAGYALAS